MRIKKVSRLPCSQEGALKVTGATKGDSNRCFPERQSSRSLSVLDGSEVAHENGQTPSVQRVAGRLAAGQVLSSNSNPAAGNRENRGSREFGGTMSK